MLSKGHNIQFYVYVVFCVFFMALSIKFPAVNSTFSSFVVDVSAPFLRAIQKPGEWAVAVEESVSDHVGVYEENQTLREEIQDKQRLARDLAIIEQENEELRSLLSMVNKISGKSIATRVISDKKSAFSHTVIVNVGKVEGVEKGQVVVNDMGLVGRVYDVYENTSRVILLTDHASRIPVKIIGAKVRGIVRGTNSEYLELYFIEDEKASIKAGMVVATTGADGIFPEGIPVGTVNMVGKRIFINPDANFNKLDLVSIQRQEMKGILDGN